MLGLVFGFVWEGDWRLVRRGYCLDGGIELQEATEGVRMLVVLGIVKGEKAGRNARDWEREGAAKGWGKE